MSHIMARGLGPRSLFALKFGVEAARMEGIAGILAFKIPPREKEFIDVMFTAGAVDVIARWGESA